MTYETKTSDKVCALDKVMKHVAVKIQKKKYLKLFSPFFFFFFLGGEGGSG